jgi:hypothetical protein
MQNAQDKAGFVAARSVVDGWRKTGCMHYFFLPFVTFSRVNSYLPKADPSLVHFCTIDCQIKILGETRKNGDGGIDRSEMICRALN